MPPRLFSVLRAAPAAGAAALLAGLAQAQALALGPLGQPQGWLQVLSLAALAGLLLHGSARARRGFALGWLFGLGWLGGTFWWLFISMHTYGGLAAPLAALAVLALAGFLALYYGVAAAVAARCMSPWARHAPLRASLAFAAVWTLAELARGTWLTGFPWGAGGYAHVDGPLALAARYAGVYGVGFAAAALAAALALAAHMRWRRWPVWAALALLLTAGGWAFTARQSVLDAPGTPDMDVTLLQGQIPQDEKFVPGTGVAESLRWYGAQLAQSSATLVVAPETAIPLLPAQLPDEYWQALQGRFNTPLQAALLGIPLGSYEEGYTNSVIGLKARQTAPYRYDKHHLVPFGEFIPPLFKWFVQMMNIPLGDFNRGSVGQPSFEWQGQRLAPNICYEDLFGEELATRFTHGTAQAPTAFVNLSNIAWFGDTVAVDQHLHISRMRALEFERPMLRATNTGATAIIDHRGRVTHRLPNHVRDALHGRFEGRTHLTPYARWASRWGLWPLWLGCLTALGALAWAMRGSRQA